LTFNSEDMKEDKKKRGFVVALCLLVIAASGVVAFFSMGMGRAHATDRHRPKVSQTPAMAERLRDGFGLDAKQFEAVKQIMADTEDKMQVIRADTKLSKQERMDQLNANLQAASAEIKKVLTDEQRARYDEVLGSAHKM
jgi:hypothetical protein